MEERQMATKKILERMKIEQSNTIEGVEGVSSGDELDSEEDDDLSPENDGFMGSNGRQGADGSIAGASGSGSGGQNVRANVVGKRRPNGPAVNRRVFGNMMGGNNPEDDEGSLDSDSDL